MTLEDGLEKHLNNYIEQHKDMKLIVIDTFQLARGTNRESNYPNDYADTQKLKKIADRYALSDFTVTLTKRQRAIREKLMGIYSTSGIETPITEHVMEGFPSNERPEAKQVLESLLTSGELVMLTPQICLYRKDYDRILEAVKTHFEINDSLTLAQLRDMLNTSRKYAQAIVEYFDKIHITKKDGDMHYLDQGF